MLYLNFQIGTMVVGIKIMMNEHLFLRNPEDSVLGRKIVKHGLELINKLGFENFTFKKLAEYINTTEAGIYRYFENKHRLLVYLITWYWSCLEYKVIYSTNNIYDPKVKIKKIVAILTANDDLNLPMDYIDERLAANLAMIEGSKAYLTRQVDKDNQSRLFKPYKDLCNQIAAVIKELNPQYQFAHSLATTLVETSQSQKYFMTHLPALTDFGKQKSDKRLLSFLETLIFDSTK